MQRNLCHCVRLVFLIPAVYLLRQTESVWRRYRVLSEKSNRQKFDADWAGRTTTWQVVQHTWHVRTADVGQPYCDMWQTRMTTRGMSVRRTRGITRTRHVSSGFGLFRVRFDQYGGDTCHHSQGDMWHDMTDVAR
jgi:hypothetical protein